MSRSRQLVSLTMFRLEKFLAGRKRLGGKAQLAQQVRQRLTYRLVVIDDRNQWEHPPRVGYTASLHISPFVTSPCDERYETPRVSLYCALVLRRQQASVGVIFVQIRTSFRGSRQSVSVALLPRPGFGCGWSCRWGQGIHIAPRFRRPQGLRAAIGLRRRRDGCELPRWDEVPPRSQRRDRRGRPRDKALAWTRWLRLRDLAGRTTT